MRSSAWPALVVALALAALAPAAHARDGIEGTWHFGGGQVLVEPTGEGSFKGTVVAPTRFAECDHPAGERMWEITRRAGGRYEGTHVWYRVGDCTPIPGGAAIWRVREEASRFILDFCTTRPGQPAPAQFGDGECSALERAKPPAPAPPREVCRDGACLTAPAPLSRVGCLPRDVRHAFRVRRLVQRRGRRVARVESVVFRLDRRRIGTDRRAPFAVRVAARRLRRGRHVLRAEVTLRSLRTGARYRRTLSYRFAACER